MSVRDPRSTPRVLLTGSVDELDVTSYEDATVLERRDLVKGTTIRHSVWIGHKNELDHVIEHLLKMRDLRDAGKET